jgi:hypothetical protein
VRPLQQRKNFTAGATQNSESSAVRDNDPDADLEEGPRCGACPTKDGQRDRTAGATQPSEECSRARPVQLQGAQHPRGAAARNKPDDLPSAESATRKARPPRRGPPLNQHVHPA